MPRQLPAAPEAARLEGGGVVSPQRGGWWPESCLTTLLAALILVAVPVTLLACGVWWAT
jgi:hypothetical protein